jgi:MSHA biogenesis protein MshI
VIRIDRSRLRSRLNQLLAARRRLLPWIVADLQTMYLRTVCVAPARPGERPVVLGTSTLELDTMAPDARALAAFAQTLQRGRQRWALLLPRDDYRLSVIPEPEVPAAELVQSLRWQLSTTLDFPTEEASIDFLQIPTRAWQPERTAELYVVAARGTAVHAQAALFRAAHLDLRAIDIRETAQRNIATLLERDGELLVLVAFCDDEVRISFNWQHELYMDRLIAEPSVHDQTPQRRTAACERIQWQVQRSLDAVRANYPFMQAARIMLAGAPEGFAGILMAAVPEPVEELVPELLFDLSRVPELGDPRVFMRYFHALGVALREREDMA